MENLKNSEIKMKIWMKVWMNADETVDDSHWKSMKRGQKNRVKRLGGLEFKWMKEWMKIWMNADEIWMKSG